MRFLRGGLIRAAVLLAMSADTLRALDAERVRQLNDEDLDEVPDEDLDEDVDEEPDRAGREEYLARRDAGDELDGDVEFLGLAPELYLWRAPPPEVFIPPALLAGVKARVAAQLLDAELRASSLPRPRSAPIGLEPWQVLTSLTTPEPVPAAPMERVEAPRRRGRCPFPPAELWRGQRRTWGAR